MRTIQAIKVGNTVNVSVNGKLHKKNCATPDEAKDLYKRILEIRANPTDENYDDLLSLINERLRIAYLCGLETDPETGNAYLAGFNTPIPRGLLDVMKEYHENEYPLDSIINFWKLLMINPDKTIRNTLFEFISKHDFVLTDNGYMLVYKAVYLKENNAKTHETSKLEEFVSAMYHKVKQDWKTSPKRYVVYSDEEGLHITKKIASDKWDEAKSERIEGNLDELFDAIGSDEATLFDKTVYTDMYTREMKIKLGETVTKDRTECNGDPQVECSYGLHVGATSYVESYASSRSKILVCLVNPANVVAVPNYDKSKMRVTEYFPFALAERDNGKIDIIEHPYYENDYKDIEVTELEAMIEAVKKEELPIETAKNVQKEERSFAELKKMIENRMIDLRK